MDVHTVSSWGPGVHRHVTHAQVPASFFGSVGSAGTERAKYGEEAARGRVRSETHRDGHTHARSHSDPLGNTYINMYVYVYKYVHKYSQIHKDVGTYETHTHVCLVLSGPVLVSALT